MSANDKKTFCKFRALQCECTSSAVVRKYNPHLCDILSHCRLFGASFDELNDIDEGRFVFSQELLNRIGEIRSGKEKLRICCFSLEDTKLCLDLMWAHYGNAHCGVKIDFEIDCSQNTIKEVCEVKYGSNFKRYNGENSEKFSTYILTRKKECFAYEREYRAIWDTKDNKSSYIPIIIKKITIGRRFADKTITNEKIEKEPFTPNDRSVKLAKSLFKIWQCGKCKGGSEPQFYAYKTKYSNTPERIEPTLYGGSNSL